MSTLLHERLAALQAQNIAILTQKGLEKECLRVTPAGRIALTGHPERLGSTLTHPSITTDYSEALLEFITPPHEHSAETLKFLSQVHQFVGLQLEHDELLWPNSMPYVAHEADIPIAVYGKSNIGRMKHVYRQGLAYRYGKKMQAIAGIHFNFSFHTELFNWLASLEKPQFGQQCFINQCYFNLIRNYLRYSWLIPYLFGASPAIDKGFAPENKLKLTSFDADTYVAEYGTSLRLSDIGYRNNAQALLNISYNSLHNYVCGLLKAITTSDPNYEKIGVKVDGVFRQLNTHILQIENEYYGSVRPKQTALRGERPTTALKKRGIEYVEIRALDLNPFEPMGISLQQMLFMEVFLLFCLLQESPLFTEAEQQELTANYKDVIMFGRKPGLLLLQENKAIAFTEAAQQLFTELMAVAEVLETQGQQKGYLAAVKNELQKIDDVSLTPSAKVLEQMRTHQESFAAFNLRIAKEHAHYFKTQAFDAQALTYFTEMAKTSMAEQAAMEAADTLSFDEFVQRYYSDCQELSCDKSGKF